MGPEKQFFGSAAILAGGKSSRFGEDKALIPLGEATLIEYIIVQLKKQFDDIIIISNKPEEYNFCELYIHPDLIPGAGPLGGLHAALSAATTQYVFVTACDMPFVSAPLVNLMKKTVEQQHPDAVTAAPGGFIEPFHALYSKKLTGRLEKAVTEGSGSLFSFSKNIETSLIENEQLNALNIDRSFFSSINSKEDLAAFQPGVKI